MRLQLIVNRFSTLGDERGKRKRKKEKRDSNSCCYYRWYILRNESILLGKSGTGYSSSQFSICATWYSMYLVVPCVQPSTHCTRSTDVSVLQLGKRYCHIISIEFIVRLWPSVSQQTVLRVMSSICLWQKYHQDIGSWLVNQSIN